MTTATMMASLIVGIWLVGSPPAVQSAETARDPLQAAEETARQGQALLEHARRQAVPRPPASMVPDPALRPLAEQILRESAAVWGRTLPQPVAESRREGLWIALSWSMPEAVIREYFDQARRLGATVVFRGVLERSMRATAERLRTVFGERAEHAASVVIDPPLIRRCQVEAVPALLVATNGHCWSVVGATGVAVWLRELAEADARWQPLLAWYLRQTPKLWEANQPIAEGRPVLPPLSDDRRLVVPGEQWAFAEADLEEALREAVARTDWQAVQTRLRARLTAKLTAGPGLALPAATTPRHRLVDPTVTLPEDLVEPTQGVMLAKAGTRVNPLAHVRLRQTLVVLDGTRPAELAWADRWLAAPGHGPAQVLVLLTRGDAAQLMARWQRRVYWASAELLARVGVEATPATVQQDGEQLRVEEHVAR
jgi:conjugal transfer pilus assembly protein TraW